MDDLPEGFDVYRSEPVQSAWPSLDCYGCGPANEEGIGLESYLSDDGGSLVADVEPEAKYTSGGPNAAYGGYVASLVDCHSVWTATTFAHLEEGLDLSDAELQYVTGSLSVDFVAPTPLDDALHLVGRVDGEAGRTVEVDTEVRSGRDVTARGEVLAVEVGGHY